jgi:voltage-gated potassium channel
LARGIPLAIGFALVAWLLSGLGFFLLEPTIDSYGGGLWLAFVSMSTVGYGDLVPTTVPSRLFAIIMVFVGFGLFSMAIAAISAYFVGEDDKLDNDRIHEDIVNLRSEIKQLREDLISVDLEASTFWPEHFGEKCLICVWSIQVESQTR